MRKVLSFVLTVSLILGSFSMAFAEETQSIVLTDLDGVAYEQAAKTLVDLGVITGMGDGTFGGDKDVTRAQMASLVCKALGLSEAGSNTFPDARNHWGAAWIGLAQSLGVITGYPDGTFKPDANVTYYEALAMIIKALGYNDDSLTGTWPNKYIAQAQRLGLTDDVTISASNAPRGDVAFMLYGALDQQVGKTNKDGEWVGDTRLVDKELQPVTMYTLLGMTLYTKQLIEMNSSAKVNLLPYVGAYADVYKNKDGEIVAVGSVDTVFLAGDYNADDNVFEADINYNITATKAADQTSATAVFLNAKKVGDGQSADLREYAYLSGLPSGASNQAIGLADIDWDNYEGEVIIAAKVTGKRIDEVKSILLWVPQDAAVISSGDLEEIEEDQSLLGFDFPLDADDEIDMTQFYLDGVASLDDIAKDNVVGVYALGITGDIVKVSVGTKVVSGKITRLSGSDATIDGTKYGVSSLAGSSSSNIKVGNEVKLYLDANGDYYKADMISGGADLVGVVIDIANNVGGLNGSDPKVKLFLADGNTSTFVINKDTEVDGRGITLYAIETDGFLGVTNGSIIKYSLNKSGEINSIETYDENDGLGTTSVSSKPVTAKGFYDGRQIVNNAVIFTYDTLTDFDSADVDDGNLGVTTLDKILDSNDIDGRYFLNSDKQIAVMILSDDGLTDAVYGFLNDHGSNDSDAENYVTVWIDGKLETYDTEQSSFNYKILYEITFNAAGEAKFKNVLDADVLLGFYSSDSSTNPAIIGDVTTDAINAKWNGNTLQFIGVMDNAGETTLGAITSGSSISFDPVRVFSWNDKDGEFKQASKNTAAGYSKAMIIWDTDGDGVADTVAVWK